MKPIYLTYRFFVIMAISIAVMAFSFLLPWLFYVALVLLGALVLLILFEYRQLRLAAPLINAQRKIGEKLSMGDIQAISYTLINDSNITLDVELIDELPYQFQERNIIEELEIPARSNKSVEYTFRPVKRGEYHFGRIQLLISYPLTGFIQYKVSRGSAYMARVYPSILQMKRFALQIFSMTASMFGIRKVRTIGENDEFEHIRQYQEGDNIKSINWKASSRKGELLVNQYQDSRSQKVFCVIDKGRNMEMPFDGMSLLDHSINTALVISNIVLSKYDKAGLITFSKNIDSFLPADFHTQQLEKVLSLLYNQETSFEESGFEKLYYTFRHKVSRRSIVFLFTNFESRSDFNRNIKYLKALSHRHLLIVICFENTQLNAKKSKEVKSMSDIYDQTIATSFLYEKKKIMIDLQHHGIQTIYTKPENLSINVINKYLEIKAKRMK